MLLNHIDSLKSSEHQQLFFKNSKIIVYMNQETPPPAKKSHRICSPPLITPNVHLQQKKSNPNLKNYLNQKAKSKPVLEPIQTAKKKQNMVVKKNVQTTRSSARKNPTANRSSGLKNLQSCPRSSNKNLFSESVLPIQTLPKPGRKSRLSNMGQPIEKKTRNYTENKLKGVTHQSKPINKKDSVSSSRNSPRSSQFNKKQDLKSMFMPSRDERSKHENQLSKKLKIGSKMQEIDLNASESEKEIFKPTANSELKQKRMKLTTEDMLSGSRFYCFQLQRAEVVKYLNHLNCEGKFLFPLLVQRKTLGDKYIDEDFSSSNIGTINGEKVFWSHLAPTANVKVFPQKFQDALIITRQKTKSLLFTNFLNTLSIVQPQVIMRIFEPSFNNIFSLWLYINGRYEPIYIDGDFPFDQNLTPLYGYSEGYPWYSILIKCLSKILGAFDYEKLGRISPQRLYELLTGTVPRSLQTNSLKNSIELFTFLQKYKNEGNILIYDKQKCEVIKQTNFQKGNIKLYNPVSKAIRVINGSQLLLENVSILISKHEYNWFVYSIEFSRGQLTKFDLQNTRKTQFIFRVSPFLLDILQKVIINNCWLYIYEVNHSRNGKQKLLDLKHQIQAKQEVKIHLRRGKYKIFLEMGEKKLGQYFSSPPINKKPEKRKQTTKNCFTIFSSQEVKVSKGTELSKSVHGRFVEDTHSLYCPSSKLPSTFN